MKHRFLLGAFLSLAVLSGTTAPTEVFAQRSSDSTMVSQDEYYRWVSGSNRTMRRRLERLDDDPVAILPIPILFGISPASIFPNFADPRSGGRSHEGEDIMAPKGAPIVSPTAAVVLDSGVWSGAGKFVSTANPGGETFVYMHLDSIADLDRGDELDPGDLIGTVGNTGNASGGAPHLHFEIRKGGATDPYPRLKGEFTLAQKMEFTEKMIDESDDEDELVDFLVATYRSHFLAAQALGIELPNEIEKEMQSTAGAGATVIPSFPEDLTVGSRGPAVTALQLFLIAQNKGVAARALAGAGATGNFGPMTQSALMEYQRAVGLVPADGYYGPLTRAHVLKTTAAVLPVPTSPAIPPAPTPSAPAVPAGAGIPSRDLTIGSTGSEVVWLQTFLSTLRKGPAAEALRTAGATGYFGPATQAALIEYQIQAGITPSTGYFGQSTRDYMASALKA